MGYTYICPTRAEARRRKLTAEMDAIRAEGDKVGFDDKLLNTLWEKRGQLDVKTPKDDWPALEGKKCRWLRLMGPNETEGVLETLEPIADLTPVQVETEGAVAWWYNEKDEIEDDPKCDDTMPQIGHIFKNHGAGRMTVAEVRDIAAGIYSKLTSDNLDEVNAAVRLRMLMNDEPLGIALENDKEAIWAEDIMAVTEGPVPKILEKAFLAKYEIEQDPESKYLGSEELAGKYPTLDKIPGWTPTNVYVGPTRKENYVTGSVEVYRWVSNAVKIARSFTTTSEHVLGALGADIKAVGTLSGSVTLKLYAGTPDAPGALLSTCEVNVTEIWSPTYSYIPFGGGGNPTLANATGYFFELSTTATLDAQNYFSIMGNATGGGAGDQSWIYSGSWASQTYKQHFWTTNNAAGGFYLARTDVASSSLFAVGGPKGAAVDSTDTVICVNGATFTVDASCTFKKWDFGDTFSDYLAVGRVVAKTGLRYGFLIVAAGVKINFGTQGGIFTVCTTPDASSKNSGITIAGTANSPTDFTNKTDALVWADYWNLYVYNVGLLSVGYYRAYYSPLSNQSLWINTCSYTLYTDLRTINLGHCLLYTSMWNNLAVTAIFTFPSATGDLPMNFTIEEFNIDFTNVTGEALTFSSWPVTPTGSFTGSFLIKKLSVKQAVSPAAYNVVKGIGCGYICPASGVTHYSRAIYCSATFTTEQCPPAIPTGLALADATYGKALYGIITNLASFQNTDVFELGLSDGTVVGRCSKTEYVANGNKIYTWPVLTDGVSTQLKIRSTNDLLVFSDWSALADAATPNHLSWDFPAVGKVTGDTVNGVNGTRTDANRDVVLQGSANYGDPDSPLVPNLPMPSGLTQQQARDSLALALSEGVTPAEGSVDVELDGIEIDTSILGTTLEQYEEGSWRFKSGALTNAVDPQVVRDAMALAPTEDLVPVAGSIDSILGLVKVVTDKLGTMIETIAGPAYRFLAAALSQAPDATAAAAAAAESAAAIDERLPASPASEGNVTAVGVAVVVVGDAVVAVDEKVDAVGEAVGDVLTQAQLLEALLAPGVRTISAAEDLVVVKSALGVTLAMFTKTSPGGVETWTRS